MKVIKVDKIKQADTFMHRLRGYMFTRQPTQREVMIFKHCNSKHTFNMRFKIDVLFLNEDNIVIKKVSSMPKRKWIKPIIGANTVVEAPEGLFKNIEENEVVLFDAL